MKERARERGDKCRPICLESVTSRESEIMIGCRRSPRRRRRYKYSHRPSPEYVLGRVIRAGMVSRFMEGEVAGLDMTCMSESSQLFAVANFHLLCVCLKLEEIRI